MLSLTPLIIKRTERCRDGPPWRFYNTNRNDNEHRENTQRHGQGEHVHNRLVDRLAVLERVAANRIIDALRISVRG